MIHTMSEVCADDYHSSKDGVIDFTQGSQEKIPEE